MTMQKPFYFFFGIFLLSIPCFSQSQIFTTKEGDQFEMELKLDKQTIMLGEPTIVSLEVKNLSEHKLSTRITELSLIDGKIAATSYLTLVDSEGKILPQTGRRKYELINDTITPAKETSVRRLLLSNFADIRRSDVYTINLSVSLYAVRTSVRYSTLFQANFAANITVIDPNYGDMGEVIKSIGRTLLDENSLDGKRENPATFALKMVETIDDERVVPILIQTLNASASISKSHTCQDLNCVHIWVGKRDIYSDAAKILIKYDSPSVWESLENAMNSDNDNVRWKVADVLAKSRNPLALEILLKFKNDKDSFVRSSLIGALEKTDTVESTQILREMLKDERQEIRERVQKILAGRGIKITL